MDKKSQKKKDRAKRVKKQVLKQRESWRKELKEKDVRERLMYMSEMKKTPYVKKTDSFLVRNNKTLQKAYAEHEAFLKFREDHKDEAQESFERAKEEQAKYAQLIKEGKDDERKDDLGA